MVVPSKGLGFIDYVRMTEKWKLLFIVYWEEGNIIPVESIIHRCIYTYIIIYIYIYVYPIFATKHEKFFKVKGLENQMATRASRPVETPALAKDSRVGPSSFTTFSGRLPVKPRIQPLIAAELLLTYSCLREAQMDPFCVRPLP